MAQVSLPSRKKARMTESEIRCVPCIRLFSSQGAKDLQSEVGFTHLTRKGAEDSVKEGCSLCGFLVQVGKEKFGKDKWRADDSLVFRSQPQPENQAAQLTILQGRVEGSDEVLTIYPFAKRGDPLSQLIPRRPVHRDVQSNTVFAAAKRLIHACMRPDNRNEGHALCRYSRETVLPTRVLDVGDPSDPDSSTKLKINKNDTHGSYLALSYCWGERDKEARPQPLLLRTKTLDHLKSEISLETLQKSIQDAILVTRKLGFRYLWVDALCIIQDDAKDKDHEISQMATIYKNAAITLAAGTAERAAEGFLGSIPSRPNVYLPEEKFAIPIENSTDFGTVYLSADPYEPNHPLDKRGWTLQEFMLSSRMLVFSDYQLLWQCKEVELRSVTGDSRGMEYQQPLESLPWTIFDEEAEPLFGTSASEKLYIWKTIILQYTERELSDPNDRLRAVSGITTELEKLWRDSNFWGLWRQWFLSLLVWYKDDIDRVYKRNLGRAPSWSWASLDGRIKYKDPVEVPDAEIITLTKESVVLSCRILNVDNDDESDEFDEFDESNDPVVEWLDLADKVCKEHGLTHFCPPGSRDQCRPNLIRPRSKETGENDLLYLLLGNAKPDSRGGKGLGLGLLVMKVADGRYRRIGLAVFPDMSIWEGVKRETVEFEREH